MSCEPSMSARQAMLVRELARTPGNPVHWAILADAIGRDAVSRADRQSVYRVVETLRAKFGQDIIRATGRGCTAGGYYLPADWNER